MTKRSGELQPPRVYAIILASIGTILAIYGKKLVSLDGSPYYCVVGILLLVVAGLLWRGHVWGARLYGLVFAGTVAWALWEVGFDGWALMPRVAAPALLGLWLVMPWTRRRLGGNRSRGGSDLRWGLGAVAAVAFGIAGVFLYAGEPAPRLLAAITPLPAVPAAFIPSDGDWVHYGNTLAGTRFSQLDQITPQNVRNLSVAWIYHLGNQQDGRKSALEVTPIKVGDSLYLCDAFNDVIALDAETGQLRWRFDAHTDRNWALHPVCRGVGYLRVAEGADSCSERIFTNTTDARLIALDAHTGQLCAGFGNDGVVSLLIGMGQVKSGYYEPSSAPTIVRGKIVVGGLVADNQEWGEPSGVIRAFDAMTGKLAWAFDLGRPSQHGEPATGEEYTRSTPNVWAPMSADESLGLVYVPTGNATPDHYGGQRRSFDDEFSSSVVAINAETGDVRWKFQTVHHDLWDYDVSSQPTLIDLHNGDKTEPALIVSTKQGQIFVLNRVTGQPLFPVVETPVAQAGTVPEEHLSPTQPFSVGLPAFAGAPLTEAKMWGLTPIDQLWCRIKFREARYEGTFTPPGLQPSIAYPGYLGGIDWGGIAVDTDNGLMVVNAGYVANYIQLLPRAAADALGLKPWGEGQVASETIKGAEGNAQANTPYASLVAPFMSPLNAPCQQPPYSTLSLVDLKTGSLVWSRTLGTARDSGPFGLSSMLPLALGAPGIGGAVVTRSGLTFIAATQELTIRAIDTLTGKTLWSSRLPAGGQATPMTYVSPASGRQFVVIAAGGHPWLGTKLGDSIVAYALPETR